MAYQFKRASFGNGVLRVGLSCGSLFIGHVPANIKTHFDDTMERGY